MAPLRKKKVKRSWEDIAKEAQNYRDASILELERDLPYAYKQKDQGYSPLPQNSIPCVAEALGPRALEITSMPPEDLIRGLRDGELTALAVTTAFLHRASIAQKLVRSQHSTLLPESDHFP